MPSFLNHTIPPHGYHFRRFTVSALLLASTIAFASDLQADNHRVYTLPRIGGLIIRADNINDIKVVGVAVGVRVDTALYIETELNNSVSGGDYFNTNTNEEGQLQISNLSLFGVYRHVWNNRFYGKLKAGIAYKSLEYDVSANPDIVEKGDSFGAAGGAGVGIVYHLSGKPAMVEIEYAIIDKDISLFTIGMTIPF